MSETARRRGGRFAELIALCGLTVVQPVLSTFGDNATDLVFRRTSGRDLVVFGLLLAVVPALGLWLIGLAVDVFDRRAGAIAHHATVGALVGLFALQLLKDLGSVTGWPLALMTVGITGLAAVLRDRREVVGAGLRLMAVAPVLFLINFWFVSPASGVLDAGGTADAARLDMDRPGDVVVLVFDELPTRSLLGPDGTIDAELWPAFAELADQSTWYRNATSVSPTTPTAVPALLTGRLPTDATDEGEVLPLLDDHPQNLFTAFAGTHDVRAHESVTQLCPAVACRDAEATGGTVGSLIDDAVDVWWRFSSLSEPDEATIDFRARQSDPSADQKIAAWLETIEPAAAGDRPMLAFLHALWPHQPWWRTPDGRRYDAPVVAEGLGSTYTWTDDTSPLAAQQRHLMQLQYTDRQLATIMATLRQRGRWDDATVIVTADHGVSFAPGDPIRGLGAANEAAVAWVPFFVKDPDQQDARIDERPTSTIDLVPTALAAVGADPPWPLDGLAVDQARTDQDRPFADWRLSTRDPDDGQFATIDGVAGYAALLDADPVVGPGPDPSLRLYRWGRHGALVGRGLADLTVAGTSAYTMALEHADDLADFDPAADDLPIYVSGVVAPAQPADFAVAVNGTVAMWGRSKVVTSGDHRLWATVVPGTVAPGSNQVRVFEIDDDGCAPGTDPVECVALAEVALTAAPDAEE